MDSDTLISNKRAEQFEHTLAMLAAGIPLETVLAEAGGDADWLRPMLETAALTAELKHAVVIPPPQASLQRMLAHSQTMTAPPVKSAPKPNPLTAILGLLSRGLAPLATGFKGAALAASLLTAFLAGTIMGGGLSFAAQDSLPGQPLYGLKRTEETIRLNLTANPVSRERLLETFRLRRQMETTLLLHQGEHVMVVIEDKITAISDNVITIDGFATELTPETTITGELTVGAQVRLEAVTRPPDQLTALTIIVTTPGPPTPTSSPSPTATSTPNPSPTPTITPTAPTATSQAADTLPVAVPDDDIAGNDNRSDDDNSGNDNDNSDNDDDDDDDNADDEDDDANDNSDDDDNSSDDNSNDDNDSDDHLADDSSNDNGDGDSDDLSDGSGDDNDSDDDSSEDNSGSGSEDDDSGDDDNSGSGSDSDDNRSDDSNSGSSDDSSGSSGGGGDNDSDSDDSSGGGDDDDDDDDD